MRNQNASDPFSSPQERNLLKSPEKLKRNVDWVEVPLCVCVCVCVGVFCECV